MIHLRVPLDRLVGLVVRSPSGEQEVQGSNPCLSRSSYTNVLRAILPGSWRDRGGLAPIGLISLYCDYCDWVRAV